MSDLQHSDSHGAADPAPGWYADPTGLAGVRWWDGAQWTSYTAPMPASAPGADVAVRPSLPQGAPIYTPFIWIYALLPLVSSVAIFFYQPAMPGLSADGHVVQAKLSDTFTPGYFGLVAAGLLTSVASIVMAYFDHRRLLRLGVVRPFHWAWAFFVFVSPGMLVYPIGRSVIVRQVARPRGLAPIWVLGGSFVISIVLAVVWMVVVFGRIFAQLSSLHPYGA